MEDRQRQALERQRRLERRVEISQLSSISSQRRIPLISAQRQVSGSQRQVPEESQQVLESNQLLFSQRSGLSSTSASNSESDQDFESLGEEEQPETEQLEEENSNSIHHIEDSIESSLSQIDLDLHPEEIDQHQHQEEIHQHQHQEEIHHQENQMNLSDSDYQTLLQRVQVLEAQNQASDAQNQTNETEFNRIKTFLPYIFEGEKIASENSCFKLISDDTSDYKIFDNERLSFANVYGRIKVIEKIQSKFVNSKYHYSQWGLLIMRHMDSQLLNLLPNEIVSDHNNVNTAKYLDIVKYLVNDIDFTRLHQKLALSIMNWRPKIGTSVLENIHKLITAGYQVRKFELEQVVRVKVFDLLDYYVPLWDFKSFTFEALKWSEINKFVNGINLSKLIVGEDYLTHLDNIGKGIPKEFDLLGNVHIIDSSVVSPYSSVNKIQDHSVMAINPWIKNSNRFNHGNHSSTSLFRRRDHSREERSVMNCDIEDNDQEEGTTTTHERYWCKSCNCESCKKHQKGYNEYIQRKQSGRVNVIAVEASGKPIVYIESPYCQNSLQEEVYFVDSNEAAKVHEESEAVKSADNQYRYIYNED